MKATFGRVMFSGNSWLIEAEPFVRTRMKRVFPRAPQHAAQHIRISATPENTRELQWFLHRYPMEVDREDLMIDLAEQHRETEQRVADLMTGHTPPVSVALAEPPRSYQEFAAQLLEIKEGYLLADDLGVGKSVSGICGMTNPANLPALVVCQAHLPRQWRAMLKRFAPSLTTHILKKTAPYDLTPRPRGKNGASQPPEPFPDVIITSYHKLRGWAETLRGIVKYVIYDECQNLRRPGTEIYRAACHVAGGARRRMGLSATPIHNYGNEFYHVLDVLSPGALGEYSEFLREWCRGDGDKARLADPAEFSAYLRREGLMLRRTRSDVGRELPSLSKIVHEIDADEKVLDAMKGNAVELAKIVLRHNEQFRGQKMRAAGELDSLLRQATGIAKAPYVVEFVKLLLDSDEPIILYGWHRAVYDLWMEGLAAYSPVLYTGTESPAQKEEAIARFCSGQSRLMIMSLRSGAGVDGLQGHCHTGVLGELDWSPSVHEQCIGRFYRDGQTRPCAAYFLVSNHGADPIMADVLGIKRDQSEGVLNPDYAFAERIDTGEAHLRLLARDFLAKRGIQVPTSAVVSPLHDIDAPALEAL